VRYREVDRTTDGASKEREIEGRREDAETQLREAIERFVDASCRLKSDDGGAWIQSPDSNVWFPATSLLQAAA
jgi:hypothetical protein